MAPMGGGGGSCNKFSNNRGRPYAMMLLIAFGLAVFGVMVLHKLRERRIFNILIKDKDRDIVTLQLLLQKEKYYTKEAKKKIEELKAKAQYLRTRKMELNNKLMDIQFTAASLKEEGRALESELEEKRNEIKRLKEKEINSSQEDSQRAALTELLKQKEVEIEDMKRRLENPTNVWSVSTDDPLKPHINLSATEVVLNKAKNEVNQSVEKHATSNDGQAKKSVKASESLTAKSEGARESTDQDAIQGEGQLQKFEYKQDGERSKEGGGDGEKNGEEVQSKGEVSEDMKLEKSKSSQDDENLKMKGIEGKSNETQVEQSSRNDDVLKTTEEDADTKAVDGKEDGMSKNQEENFENSQFGEGRLLSVFSKYEGKREVSNGSQNDESSKDSGRIQTENKRWRRISRNREMVNNGNSEEGVEEVQKTESLQDNKTDLGTDDESLRTRTDSDDQIGLEGKEDGVASSEGNLKTFENTGDSEGEDWVQLSGGKQEEISTDGQLLKPQNTQDGEDLRIEETTTESNQQVGKDDEMVTEDEQSEKANDSQDVESASDNSSTPDNDTEERPKEQEATDVQKPVQRELQRRHSKLSKRRRIPKVKKGQKTWKTTVFEDNPDF